MIDKEKTYQHIEEYLAGTLSEENRIAFEAVLKVDPSLQLKVKTFQLADKLIVENRLLSIKELAKETHIRASKGNSFLTKGAVVVGTLILVLGSIWHFNKKEKANLNLEVTPQREVSKKEPPIIERKAQKVPTLKPSNQTAYKKEVRKVIDESVLKQDSTKTEILTESTEEEEIVQPKVNKKQTHLQIEPCANVHIDVNTYIAPTCRNQAEGHLILSEIRGGTKPYNVSLLNQENDIVPLSSLKAGQYMLVITDKNYCNFYKAINVGEKQCTENHYFNPYVGETWEILEYPSNGTLNVFDKAGNIYFSMKLENGVKNTWNGQSIKGDLETGYFLFTISYEDGIKKTGSVTIVK